MNLIIWMKGDNSFWHGIRYFSSPDLCLYHGTCKLLCLECLDGFAAVFEVEIGVFMNILCIKKAGPWQFICAWIVCHINVGRASK